jgi:hypothetical protein
MLNHFVLYAAAFEKAYQSRDFAILEPFFTQDAVYEIQRPAEPTLLIRGRDRLLAYMAWTTEHFDLRFAKREILRIDGPHVDANAVRVHGVAVYTLDTWERCHLSMGETAIFRGDRIERLVDRISPGGFHEMKWIVENHPDRFAPDVLELPSAFAGQGA